MAGKDRPAVGDKFQDKSRWLQCGIKNQTEFNISTTSSHFDSGRYEDHPGVVQAFELATFTACNGDNTFMTGVSGGQAYRITIDQNTDFQFSIVSACLYSVRKVANGFCVFSQGFTNPYSGTYKAGVTTGGNPEDGYSAASQDGGSIRSDLYQAEDEDGEKFTFRISVTATASQRPSFVVTEDRWY